MKQFALILTGLSLRAASTAAFAPSALSFVTVRGISSAKKSRLRASVADVDAASVIKPETDDDDVWDLSLGDVGLAMESAVKIGGDIDLESGEAKAINMMHYAKPTEFDFEADAKGVMDKFGVTLVCNGLGKELYKDPGKSTAFEVAHAPSVAARAALSSVSNASVSKAKSVVLNFLGGNDLMWAEVLDACSLVVDGLDISDGAKVTFNSLCHKDFQDQICSITVMAASGEARDEEVALSGVSKSVAAGEMYFYQGKWFTVTDEDLGEDA